MNPKIAKKTPPSIPVKEANANALTPPNLIVAMKSANEKARRIKTQNAPVVTNLLRSALLAMVVAVFQVAVVQVETPSIISRRRTTSSTRPLT